MKLSKDCRSMWMGSRGWPKWGVLGVNCYRKFWKGSGFCCSREKINGQKFNKDCKKLHLLKE